MAYGLKDTPATRKGMKKNTRKVDDNSLLYDDPENETMEATEEEELINPLRNEIVVVRFIERYRGITSDKEGDFYGGMGTRSEWPLYVPTKRGSSELMNPLTKSEKLYFENLLGRDLGIYAKNGEPSYWMTGTPGAWNTVMLKKSGLVLHLDQARDYFYYKILLLHKELVAGSLEELENSPRATQLFYMSSEKAELENMSSKANLKFEAYIKYGKIKDDLQILRYLIFMMENKEEGRSTTIEQLQIKVMRYIETDLPRFSDLVNDQLLETKALLIDAAKVKALIYDNRVGFFYTKNDHKKMCQEHEEPRLTAAARWINEPENHDVLMELQKKTR